MGVISSETTISRRPCNVNLSAGRKRPPEDEETKTCRKGTKRRLKYVADRKLRNRAEKSKDRENVEGKRSGDGTGLYVSSGGTKAVLAASSGITKPAEAKTLKKASGIYHISAGKHIRHSGCKSIKVKGNAEWENETEWDGNRTHRDSEEYTGRGKTSAPKKQAVQARRIAGAFLFQLLLFAKAVAAAILNIIVAAAVTAVIIVVITMATIESATYGFMTDEEIYIRKVMSKVTADISAGIDAQKEQNACGAIYVTGELCDWKEVIAFWWTLRCQGTGAQGGYMSGNDYEDIRLIFHQFNIMSFTVPDETETPENAQGRRVLQVQITNTPVEQLERQWGFDDGQEAYMDELLADDELWEEILGMTELSRIGYGQTGKSGNLYTEGRTAEPNTAFVCWCISQAGGMTEGYIDEEESALNLMYQLNRKGFGESAGNYEPKKGDIAFLSTQGGTKAGIVTGITDDSVYVVLAHYMSQSDVEEIEVAKNSGQIRSYAHISGFYIEAISGAKSGNIILAGGGSLLWPVGGEYYTVTSKYGPRDMFGRNFHYGMDIACPVGTPIVACMDGTVAAAGYNASMGNYVTLTHADGMQTTYMHNSQLMVAPGESVPAGSIIALSGNTGQSTGPHCHLSVKINGENTDPAPYLGLPEGFEGDAGGYIK